MSKHREYNSRLTFFRRAIVCFFLVFGFLGCSGDNDGPSLTPGDTSEVTLTQDGQTLMKITYMLVDTDPGVGPSTKWNGIPDKYIEIPISIEYYGQAMAGESQYADAIKTTTENELRIFLYNIWDEYVNGVDDDGVNGAAFTSMIRERELNVASFLYLFENSGYTISEFMDFIQSMERELGTEGIEQELNELEQFLIYTGYDVSQFLDALYGAGMVPSDLWAHMFQQSWGFRELTDAYGRAVMQDDTTTLTSFFLSLKSAQSAVTNNQIEPKDIGEIVIDVLKLVWDIIKDGKPIAESKGAFTAVLHKDDMNWQNYYASTLGKSKHHRFHSTYYGLFDVVNVEFEDMIYYKAKHEKYAGAWVPLAYVEFTDVVALWPNHLNGTADILPPINIGTPEIPDPRFTMTVNVTLSNFLGSRKLIWVATIEGSKGIVSEN